MPFLGLYSSISFWTDNISNPTFNHAENGSGTSLQVGAKLVVLNLSQQTDSSDLLGGFRPVQPHDALRPLLGQIQTLFQRTWKQGATNRAWLDAVTRLANRRDWPRLIQAFRDAIKKVRQESLRFSCGWCVSDCGALARAAGRCSSTLKHLNIRGGGAVCEEIL